MARVFISHSSLDDEVSRRLMQSLREENFDRVFLDFDKHAGIQPGTDWEKTLYSEIEACQAVIVILTKNWLDSKWCFAEFAQARALGKAIFPVIETPSGEAIVGGDLQSIDLTSDREGGLERLFMALNETALQSPEGFKLEKGTSPFPGLSAFEENHAAVFFGRDDIISKLLEVLRQRRTRGGDRLIALLGASGSGKSSLLRAGLLPRLRRDQKNWIVLDVFRPEYDPFGKLIAALLFHCGNAKQLPDWEIALESEKPEAALRQIVRHLRRTFKAQEAQILIPIDQAEESFTNTSSELRERFFALLSKVLAPELPFVALATIRSDYVGLLQSEDNLLVSFSAIPLAPMPLERIGTVIRGPSRIAGIGVDDDLISTITHDAKSSDALPLIAFTLRELYDRFGGNGTLTLAEYEALGDREGGFNPLENAVRKVVEETLPQDTRSEDDNKALREAFIPGLVRLNSRGDYVRRQMKFDAVSSAAKPFIKKLIEARLLVKRGHAGRNKAIIEVAHEAIFRVWPELSSWLAEERDFLAGKNRLEDALADWEKLGGQEKGLLTGILLERAHTWLLDYPGRLNEAEREYLRLSIDHDTQIRKQAEEQKERLRKAELEAVRLEKLQAEERAMAARRFQKGAIFAALVLAVFAVGAGYAAWRAINAEKLAVTAQMEERAAREHAEETERDAIYLTTSLVFDVVQQINNLAGVDVGVVESLMEATQEFQQKLRETGRMKPQMLLGESRAHMGVAGTLLARGETEKAIERAEQGLLVARELVALEPESRDWRLHLANTLSDIGATKLDLADLEGANENMVESLAISRKLADAEPDNHDLHFGLLRSLIRLGSYQIDVIGAHDDGHRSFAEAVKIAENALNAHPDHAQWKYVLSFAVSSLGRTKMEQGNYEAALADYSSSAEILNELIVNEPNNATYKSDLVFVEGRVASLYFEQEEFVKTIETCNSALIRIGNLLLLSPQNILWQRAQALLLALKGDAQLTLGHVEDASPGIEQSLRTIQTLSDADTDNTNLLNDRAAILQRVGDLRLAEGDVEAALAAFLMANKIADQLILSAPANPKYKLGKVEQLKRIIEISPLEDRARYGELALALLSELDGQAILKPKHASWPEDIRAAMAGGDQDQ